MCGVIELYFADESGVTMQPYVPYGWQRKGEPIQISSRSKSNRINLLGFMRLDNHLTIYHSERSLTGDFVVKSLNDFIRKGHEKPVVIVWDNGPIHRCQAVYERIADWETQEVYLFFLPAYSPHLNPIEIFWRFMKYRWLSKRAYASWSRLKKAVFGIIANFGQAYEIDFSGFEQNNIIQFNSA